MKPAAPPCAKRLCVIGAEELLAVKALEGDFDSGFGD
jgi:hypothetical protein